MSGTNPGGNGMRIHPAEKLEKGTTARQTEVLSAHLPGFGRMRKHFQVQTPAIILVGKVCTLSEKFDWGKSLPSVGKTDPDHPTEVEQFQAGRKAPGIGGTGN